MAAWAPLVPFAQARAAIGEGTLGLLLLCLGTGSVVTMSLSGVLVARFGCRRVVIASAVPLWPAALLGFALVGAGCANVVPVLYSSVGRQTVVPEHVAVSTITMLGYA